MSKAAGQWPVSRGESVLPNGLAGRWPSRAAARSAGRGALCSLGNTPFALLTPALAELGRKLRLDPGQPGTNGLAKRSVQYRAISAARPPTRSPGSATRLPSREVCDGRSVTCAGDHEVDRLSAHAGPRVREQVRHVPADVSVGKENEPEHWTTIFIGRERGVCPKLIRSSP